MSEPIFKPQDFDGIRAPIKIEDFWRAAAVRANAKIIQLLGPQLYGQVPPGEVKIYWFEKQTSRDTHTCRAFDVRPIECEHKRTKIWEPHLAGARKCLDCEKVYNPNRTPAWQMECEPHLPTLKSKQPVTIPQCNEPIGAALLLGCSIVCAKCGKELTAEWRTK